MMPWLIAHALSFWGNVEGPSGNLDTFIRIRTRKVELFTCWVKGIARSGWLDLLVPFLDLVEGWAGSLDPSNDGGATASIVNRFPEERISDRQVARDAQAGVFLASQTLSEVIKSLRDIHPSERSKAQKWFLALWRQ